MSPGRYLVPVVLLAIVGAAGWLGWRAQEANRAYVAAAADIDSLRVLTRSDPTTLSSVTLAQVKTELQDLRLQLNRLDEAMSIPIGEAVLTHLPWVGLRYAAARDVVRIGLLATDVGTALVQVDDDVQHTLGSGGLSKPLSGGPSWLAALQANEARLASAADAIESIQTIRSGMDDSVLPARVRVRLTEIDDALDQPQVKTLRALDFG